MKRKATRSDIASFSTVYRDTSKAYRDLAHAAWQAALFTVLIPVHLAVWLWLPELSADERAKRDEQARRWADDDI